MEIETIKYDVGMSIKKIKFSDLFEYEKKSMIKAGDGLAEGEYPFYTSSSVLSKYLDEYTFDKTSLIFGTGGNASIHYCESPFSVSTDCLVVFAKDETICLPRFVFYYLFGNINLLEEGFKGAGLKHISKGFINDLDIPLPPLPIQKRIAEILDAADALKRKDQELLKKYDELAQAIFIDMFGDPVKNEKGVALNSLIKINPTKSEIKIEDELDVTFVPMSNVGEDGDFNNIETRKYSEVKSGFTYFSEGDVLFAKITPCMENGKGTIAKDLKNGVGFGSTEFHVLRPNEKLNSQFLFHLTKLTNFRIFAEANMTGSAGQKRVPTDFFQKIKIDVSKLEKQNEFANAIDILSVQKQMIIKEIIDSDNLFQILIQKAFKGELVS